MSGAVPFVLGMLWGVVGTPAPVPVVPPAPVLVEVGSSEEKEGWSPRDLQPLEDAIAQAYDGQGFRVETRRQRLSRTPPQVYWHAQALQACANPRWVRDRVLKCVQEVKFPHPAFVRPRNARATHLLRISRGRTEEGEILALTFTALGRDSSETVVRRVLGEDATLGERKTAVLEMAAELLAVLRKP